MSDEIIEDYIITGEWDEDNALIFPTGESGGGGGGVSPQTPPASFGTDEPHIVGTIGGAQWGDVGGAFSCSNGTLTVPLPPKATYTSGTTITTSSPGLISGVEFSKTDTTSEIDDGLIKLAAANASAQCDGTTDGTPGGIYGIGYGSGNAFSIDKGYIRIPKPTGPTDGIDGLYNAETAKGMTWAELRGAGPVRLSYSSSYGYGVTAKMFNNFLSLYIS